MEKIQAFLLNKQIKVPDDWLEQCIEHIRSEFGPSMPFNKLAENVFQQWMTADLAAFQLPVLPTCLTKANRFFLNGNFCVQMNSIFDSSVSAYNQLQRITNTENENVEVTGEEEAKKPWEQSKPKRMLVMELTDGVINVRGMEYQTIPVLNIDLPPGTKILLTGRMESRKGMLMLTAENVKVIGGFVDDLLDENGQKNFLGRRVNANRRDGDGSELRSRQDPTSLLGRQNNQPQLVQNNPPQVARQNNRPQIVHPPQVVQENNRTAALIPQRISPRNLPNQSWKQRDETPSTSWNQRDEIPSSSSWNQREKIPASNWNRDKEMPPNSNARQRLEVQDDEDVTFLSDDTEEDVVFLQALDEATRDKFETPKNCSVRPKDKPKFDGSGSKSVHFYEPPAKKDRSDENFDDIPYFDDWNFTADTELLIDDQLIPISVIEDDRIDDLLSTGDHSPLARTIGQVSSSSGEFELDVVHEPAKGVDLNFRRKNKSSNQSKPNFRLTRLCDLVPKGGSNVVNSRLCTVKAAIIHTISSLNPNNGERWSFSAKITDGTAVIDCQISDEVLTELIEMTAAEAMAVRSSSIDSAKLRAVELVKKASNFVQSFNGLMQIETKFQNLAVVRKMKPLDNLEIKQLECLFLSRS